MAGHADGKGHRSASTARHTYFHRTLAHRTVDSRDDRTGCFWSGLLHARPSTNPWGAWFSLDPYRHAAVRSAPSLAVGRAHAAYGGLLGSLPLGLILGGDIDGFIDPAPMTAVLQVLVSVAYMFVTGHYVSGAHAAMTPWTLSGYRLLLSDAALSHEILPVAIALILGILGILGFPELLVPEGHRWIEYRSRIQAVFILCLGVHSALLLERLNRQHVNWSVETPRFLGVVMGLGLLAASILEYMDR